MGILFTDKIFNNQVDCEFFYVTCKFRKSSNLPSYFLTGKAYGGDSILIDTLIDETDVSNIKRLCEKAVFYDEQADLLRREKRKQMESLLDQEEIAEPEQ